MYANVLKDVGVEMMGKSVRAPARGTWERCRTWQQRSRWQGEGKTTGMINHFFPVQFSHLYFQGTSSWKSL